MKTIIYAAAVCLLAVSASAQEQEQNPNLMPTFIDIDCYKDFKPYLQALTVDYGETPLFMGKSLLPVANFTAGEPDMVEGVGLMYVNQDTGTFTNVIVFEDGSGCQINFGKDFTPSVN